MTSQEIASKLNQIEFDYYGCRARAWEGDNVSRIYFGNEYVTIENGEIHNRRGNKARALTIGDSAVEAVEAVVNG